MRVMISHHVVMTIQIEKKNVPSTAELSTFVARRNVCDVAGFYG
jgi:hypothetical protein